MYQDYASTPTKNLATYFFLTNNRDSIRIEDGDRRYMCLNVSNAKKQNIPYFASFVKSCQEPEFYDNLLTYLLKLDTSELNIHIPVMTELKREMIDSTLTYPEQFIRRAPWSKDNGWERFDDIWKRYIKWLEGKAIDSSKYAGARNKFFEKVSSLVEKRKVRGNVQYKPSDLLISYWQENDVESETEYANEVPYEIDDL
jgi:hypothetical protein